jgi:hypothetical protein
VLAGVPLMGARIEARRLRSGTLALAAILALSSCTGGSLPAPGEHRRPAAATLAPVVLRADFSQEPAAWHLVATIPYGSHTAELGQVPVGEHTPVQYLPMSFAVAPDRSIWILDWVKRRLAHYSSAGRYLGAVSGLHADRFHPHGRDVMMAGDRPVVLETTVSRNAIQLAIPAADRHFRRLRVRFHGGGVRGDTLYPAMDHVGVSVDGRPFSPNGTVSYSPRGFGRIDLSNGDLRMLPGIPLGDGTFVHPHDIGTPKFDVEFVHGEERSILPIRIAVEANGHRLPGGGAAYPQTSLRHGIVFWTRVQPYRYEDIRRYHDGRWLLALFDDGSPLLWERLPDPPTDDEIVVRHLASGPGDSIYLMQMGRRRLWIYRR